MYLHALVSKLCQLTQCTHKTLGDDIVVLKPEVKYITHKKYLLGILGNHIEPRYKTLLRATRRKLVTCTEMDVRGEIIHHK